MKRLDRLIDLGLDARSVNPGLMRRIRVVSLGTQAMVLCGGPFLIANWLWGSPALGWATLATIAAAELNLLLLRRTRRPTLCGNLAIAMLWSLLIFHNVFLGGFSSEAFVWLYVVPVASMLVVNLRSAWSWGALCVTTVVGFWLLPHLGVALPNRLDPTMGPAYALVSRTTALLAMICLAAGFAASQRRLEGTLLEANAKVQTLAFYDPLTGLPNRQSFQERLEQTLHLGERYQRMAALLFVDLDGFKAVNDTLGHGAGDEMLCEVSRRLTRSVRLSDVVALRDPPGEAHEELVSRLGGDEFTVLLAEVSGRLGTGIVAERILKTLREPIRVAGHEVYASASIGVALYPEHGRDAETLLRSAYMAMYHAKGRGRNNYQFFSLAQDAASLRRVEIEARLRHALAEASLTLHYQPIRELASGNVVGAEALLRWTDAKLGPVSPAEFIPVAEACGLITAIGKWVIRRACEQGHAWCVAGYRPIRLSVNLSPNQLRQQGLVEGLHRMLKETSWSAGLLELEITESAIMRDDALTRDTLAELSQMGVSLALDDFGTGYSSLSYLKRHPIDRVKIDCSFVSGLPDKEEDAAIVSAILAMARSLGVAVVAEGVEKEAQLAYLRARSCDAIQGHLLSPAIPAAAFERFLVLEKPQQA